MAPNHPEKSILRPVRILLGSVLDSGNFTLSVLGPDRTGPRIEDYIFEKIFFTLSSHLPKEKQTQIISLLKNLNPQSTDSTPSHVAPPPRVIDHTI